jgi:selenocysteine lyase/cysteine desulfurase
MQVSRRELFHGVGGVGLGAVAMAGGASTAALAPPPALPDRSSFRVQGTHLNAAYCHPVSVQTVAAAQRWQQSRLTSLDRNWPVDNPRDEAVALYARLINCDPAEIAVVPSTLEGENLIGAALSLGPDAGVVTDALHYDAALVRYGEMARRGMPLTVLRPRDNRIDYDELAAAIGPKTRLVAVSLVSSFTGYRHDLKRLCDIAHDKGALVYADIIQSVGGEHFDVRESGVDFCGAGHYKWLMGEFGSAFLYVRADRLQALSRVQLGWRGLKSYHTHFLPYDPPGPAAGDWALGASTAELLEVSTAGWGGLASTAEALRYINALGPDLIARHRQPMLDLLQEALPKAGYQALTPRNAHGPTVVFAREGVGALVRPRLKEARIAISVYPHRVRISPSVHNDLHDIERLLSILTA